MAVTLKPETVRQLDLWVAEGKYPNRSRALQRAADLLIDRDSRSRLTRELQNLDAKEEREFADERLGDEAWPEY